MEGRLSSKRNRGQSSVEFVFAFLIFVIMFFSISDVVLICYNWAALQYASNRSLRIVKMVHQQVPSATKKQMIQTELFKITQKLGVKLKAEDITSLNVPDIPSFYASIEINMPFTLSPFSGLLRSFGGNHSGPYVIKIVEMVENAPL